MCLAVEGDNISIYKACIKDANSLKDLTLSPLFSESNGLNTYTYRGRGASDYARMRLFISRAYTRLVISLY